MAKDVSAMSLLFCFIILPLHTVCSPGISVGFLYDARKGSDGHWSPQETLSFLEKNKVLPSQFKVLITTPPATNLGSLTSTNVADLYVSELDVQKLRKVKAGTVSLLESYVTSKPSSINIISIAVSSNKLDISSLLATLKSITWVLENLKLSTRIKVSTLLSLSTIETLDETELKLVEKVMRFLRKMEASLTIEFVVDGELSMGDAFAHSIVERALSGCAVIPNHNIPLNLHIKSCVVPSGVEIANFTAKVMKLINSQAFLRNRVSELFVDISHLKIEQKRLTWEEEQLFPSSRRELLNHASEFNAATRIMVRDGTYIPITNPVTTPITVPSTNPTMTPTVVTIPSTNPATLYPTNPTMAPVSIPYQTPVTTPITVPAVDPTPTPVVPITNPATTPSTTFTGSPSVTNPVTTYPVTPTVGTPYVAAPVTVPSTTPVMPAVSGQTWCVAKTGVPDQLLQSALDYACGIGNVDCSLLQPTGSCYYTNTLQAHASYAFNSYYQRNPVATSCDFGGTAMLVNVNPSSATCIFSSSSSTSTSNPASTYNPVPTYNPGSTYNPVTGGIGSSTGSGSSVFNSNNPGGSNSVFGSYSPTSSVNRFTLSASSFFYHFVLMIVYLSTNI